MSRRPEAKPRRWTGRALALALLAAAAGGSLPAHAAGESPAPAADAARRHAVPKHQARGLEARVEFLTKALDLDARQQREVRKLLESQREQVTAVWSDASIPAARRVAATQAVGDRTAEQIRALLNDEQKKKYGSPRQPREPAGQGPSVERWMSKGRPRTAATATEGTTAW